MVAYAPSELYPTRKYGLRLSAAINSGGSSVSGETRCGRRSKTRGHNSTCPYSMGDTLMSTTVGDTPSSSTTRAASNVEQETSPARRADVLRASASARASRNAKRISLLSALAKLNLFASNAWHTSSTENSVGLFFVARPSLNCATNPYPPGTTLVFTAVTS